MDLQASVNDASLGDVRSRRRRCFSGHYAKRRLDLHSDLVHGGDTTLHLHLSLPVDLAIEPRRRTEWMTPYGATSEPTARGSRPSPRCIRRWRIRRAPSRPVRISGTADHPMLNGDIRVANGEAGFPTPGRAIRRDAGSPAFCRRQCGRARPDGQHGDQSAPRAGSAHRMGYLRRSSGPAVRSHAHGQRSPCVEPAAGG